MFNSRFVRVYLLPGFILKSVIVAGGYGTGREIVEFFTRYGAWGGILGMITAVLFFAVVIATTYEFARVFHAYDYRSFFKKLLGPGAVVYEIVYIIFFILVLSIVGSAAGEIISDFLGLPYVFGMAGMILLVGALNFLGREIVAKSLTYWSLLLYFIFIIYFIIAVEQLGGEISRTLDAGEVFPGWIRGGLEYSWYNLGIVPAVLFAARSIETRKEAVISGAVTPFLVLLPAFFFHLTFLGAYPEIIDKELPAFLDLFHELSYADIGTQVVSSRALAGVADGVPVFCLPNSETATRLACEEIIVPETPRLTTLSGRNDGDEDEE